MPEKKVAYFGVDLHKKTATVAVMIEGEIDFKEVVKLPNERKTLKKYFKRWDDGYEVRACYEASSCGYGLYRWMIGEGYGCEVIAPSLVPKKPGEKRKTDARDAKELAELYKGGQLTAIRVPNKDEETDRSMLRARHFMKRQEVRIKQVIMNYLDMGGYKYDGEKKWIEKYIKWIKGLEMETTQRYVLDTHISGLEHTQQLIKGLDSKIEELSNKEGYVEQVKKLKSFRGIETITAMTLITEVIDFRRFSSAGELMSYFGLVPGEQSSGEREKKTSITKAGNSECRRVIVEASQHAKYRPLISKALEKRQEGQSLMTKQIAHKAMKRLHDKYWKIFFKKGASKAKVAVAREFTGFIWAMMREAA